MVGSAVLLAACAAPRAAPATEGRDPVEALMADWGLPGAQIAIARDGELLLSRADGIADEGRPVTTSTRFRIASLSKPITAAAVHVLVAEDQLALDEPVLPHLDGVPADPRWDRITVRHLLEHSAGFDRQASHDWTFESRRVARELGERGPPELDAILRVVMRRPLSFDPGSGYAYSNLGYSILGAVIEDVTGQPYERFVRERVLAPAGIERMELGRTRPDERPADEARYFPHPAEARSRSVFDDQARVPTPDGGFYLAPMAAHGGWIGTAEDLVRFMARLDGRPSPPDLISEEGLDAMLRAPSHRDWDGASIHYGHGFFVVDGPDGRAWLHDGSKPGTTAFMMRAEDGTVMAALFNGRPVEGDVSRAVEDVLRALAAAASPRRGQARDEP